MPLPKGKITGNFAAEVLADLERNDTNKDRHNAMRQLDKEINGYLKFDSNSLAQQMNNAFEGKRESWRDMNVAGPTTADHSMGEKAEMAKKKRVEAIMAEVGAKDLDPILEEVNGLDVVLYKPNMTLSEQRKLKNEELKKKVRMITGGKSEDKSDTVSQVSTTSSKDNFFITGAKTSKMGKAQFKE